MTEEELRRKWAASLKSPSPPRPALKSGQLLQALNKAVPPDERRNERRRRLTKLGEHLDNGIYLRWLHGERCDEIAADLGLERETVEEVVRALDV